MDSGAGGMAAGGAGGMAAGGVGAGGVGAGDVGAGGTAASVDGGSGITADAAVAPDGNAAPREAGPSLDGPVTCAPAAPFPRSWTAVRVSGYDSVGQVAAVALALDSRGKPRVAFNNGGRVQYAWPETLEPGNVVWSSVRLRPFAADALLVSVGNLSLDAADHPRLSFAEGPAGYGRFFTIGYFAWTGVLEEMPLYEKAATIGFPSGTTRMALSGASATPSIAFIGEGSVRFAHKPSGVWVVEDTRVVTALPIGYGGQHPYFSLAVAPDGQVAVAAVNHQQLWVSIRKEGVWTPERVVNAAEQMETAYPVLRYDEAGTLHLFYSLAAMGLRHARRGPAGWDDRPILDARLDSNVELLVEMGKGGRIHAVAGVSLPLYLRYDGCRWEPQQVRFVDEPGSPAELAMALDVAERPHFAYLASGKTAEIRYAYPTDAP
jgi:hypothetical protein